MLRSKTATPVTGRASRISAILVALGLVATTVFGVTTPAQAYVTDGLMIYLDASKSSSYGGSGSTWTDISGSGRDGTLTGGVTFDAGTQTMKFSGGANGSGFVDLNGDFDNFTNGLTIEFEGEFGSARSPWERVFDFAFAQSSSAGNIGNVANVFWVGQIGSRNELTLETWINGTNQGRCHTDVPGGALGPAGDRALHKWVLALDGTVCRIYKDGVELPTRVASAMNENTDITPSAPNGSVYPLPATTTRTSAFLGRSNFTGDADFEGSIRYIRIYNTYLNPDQVTDNINNSDPDTGPEPEPSPIAVVGLTLNAEVGDKLNGQTATITGTDLKAASDYDFTMHSDPVVLSQGTTDANGAFSETVTLPLAVCGTDGIHELILTGVDANDVAVTDSTWVELAADCSITKISDTVIVPTMPDTGLSARVMTGVIIGSVLLFAAAYVLFFSRGRLRLAGTSARVNEMMRSIESRLSHMEQRDRAAARRIAARKRRVRGE
jgi:hypothetical protein